MCPINGLSEQRRLPRLGKIRLGVKKPNKSGNGDHPEALDYFVLPEELKKLLGDEPRELPIMIPIEDDELWCSQYYKRYSSYRGLTCKGDGKKCLFRMLDKDTGAIADRNTKEVVKKYDLECWGRECPMYQAKECKETMILQFIMPDLPGLGVWQVDTGSINSIRNINNAAAMIRAVYKRITFIPLTLTLEPQEVPDKDGTKKNIHALNLRTRGTMRELLTASTQQAHEWLLISAPAEDEAPDDDGTYPAEVLKPLPQTEADKDWNNLKSATGQSVATATVIATDGQPAAQKTEVKPEPPAPAPAKKEAKPKNDKPPTDPATIKNTGDLFTACHRDFGISPPTVLKELGIKAAMDLTIPPSEAYLAIKAGYEERNAKKD